MAQNAATSVNFSSVTHKELQVKRE